MRPRCTKDTKEGDDGGVIMVVDGGVLEEVQQFYYLLGDVLDSEAGVEKAVRARVAAAWER